MKNQMSNASAPMSQQLTIGELDAVAGGTQVFKHEFPGAVNQMTGLRSFEPSFTAAVADGTLPDPK